MADIDYRKIATECANIAKQDYTPIIENINDIVYLLMKEFPYTLKDRSYYKKEFLNMKMLRVG